MNGKKKTFMTSKVWGILQTFQLALAGFHEPVEWGDWNRQRHDFWSPIPYTIDDHLLRMYAVDDCPESDHGNYTTIFNQKLKNSAWRPISEDTLPAMVARSNKSVPVREYCGNQTHWNTTNLGRLSFSLSSGRSTQPNGFWNWAIRYNKKSSERYFLWSFIETCSSTKHDSWQSAT